MFLKSTVKVTNFWSYLMSKVWGTPSSVVQAKCMLLLSLQALNCPYSIFLSVMVNSYFWVICPLLKINSYLSEPMGLISMLVLCMSQLVVILVIPATSTFTSKGVSSMGMGLKYLLNCSARSRYSCCSDVGVKLYPISAIGSSEVVLCPGFAELLATVEDSPRVTVLPPPTPERRWRSLNN